MSITAKIVAIVAAAAVTVAALYQGLDGYALTAFFAFLGGLGLANMDGSTAVK